MTPRTENAHLWLAEPLMSEPSFIEGKMFGCVACYVRGLMVLVLADGEEPWNGLLVPTEREFQKSLCAEFPGFAAHPILGKWLYLEASDENFEPRAQKLVRAIVAGHPQIGIEPGAGSSRKKRKKKKGPLKKKSGRKGAR